MSPVLTVEGLAVSVPTPSGRRWAVDDVTLAIFRGRTTALVGESGSGKSLTALSLLGLLPRGARIEKGRIACDGTDLAKLPAREWPAWRGRRIAMIFQEPMSCLNPLLPIGEQLGEAIVRRDGRAPTPGRCTAPAVWSEAAALLGRVGLPDAARALDALPYELSGGMQQRVMIAMAIAARPQVLVADEPTTALDVTVQAQILALLAALQRDLDLGLLLVTHDLAVVGSVADEVAVMYAGRVVESGPADRVLGRPLHPYTKALLGCVPGMAEAERPLLPIPGTVPGLATMPGGCRFHPRCSLAGDEAKCREAVPPWTPFGEGRSAACWKATP